MYLKQNPSNTVGNFREWLVGYNDHAKKRFLLQQDMIFLAIVITILLLFDTHPQFEFFVVISPSKLATYEKNRIRTIFPFSCG